MWFWVLVWVWFGGGRGRGSPSPCGGGPPNNLWCQVESLTWVLEPRVADRHAAHERGGQVQKPSTPLAASLLRAWKVLAHTPGNWWEEHPGKFVHDSVQVLVSCTNRGDSNLGSRIEGAKDVG